MSEDKKIDVALLEKFNITKVETLEFLFANLLNLNYLDDNLMPQIVTKNSSLIIFDNEDYNETYLIDLVKEYLEANSIPTAIKIYYCDSLEIRLKIFKPKELENVTLFTNDRKEIERKIVPGFMLLFPKHNSVETVMESILHVLDKDDVRNIFEKLKP